MKRIRFISVLFTSFFPYFFVCVRVVIDNEACKNATVIRVRFLSFFGVCACSSLPLFLVFYWVPIVHFVIQVDSANKHGKLLEVVQVLTDLNLIITKAYVSSDGGWFMDGNTFFFFPFFSVSNLAFLFGA
jgi:hypothetical protein